MEGAEEGGYNGGVLRRSTARDSFSLMPWIKRGFEKKKKVCFEFCVYWTCCVNANYEWTTCDSVGEIARNDCVIFCECRNRGNRFLQVLKTVESYFISS